MDEPLFEVDATYERMADGPYTPYDPWEELAVYAVLPRWKALQRWRGEVDVMRVLARDPFYRAWLWVWWAAHEADIWRAKWDLRLSYGLSMWITGIRNSLARIYIGAVKRMAGRDRLP